MKIRELIACACCAGIMLMTGCEGSPKQTEGAANTLGTSSAFGSSTAANTSASAPATS